LLTIFLKEETLWIIFFSLIITSFNLLAQKDDQEYLFDAMNKIEQNDIIESIEISGEMTSDSEVDKSVEEWNSAIDAIMI